MIVRRILVVTTACALAWVFSTTGRDSHAKTPGVPHGSASHSRMENLTDGIPPGGPAHRQALLGGGKCGPVRSLP